MRFLEICLLFNGLFDYFSQLQTVNFIRESSSCKEKVGGSGPGYDIKKTRQMGNDFMLLTGKEIKTVLDW